MLVCVGISSSASGFLIPQLEDPTVGFGITTDDGSWIASILEVGSLLWMCFWCIWEALGKLRDFCSVWASFLCHFGVSGGLRGYILGVLGLHSGTFGGPLASILGALGVSWAPWAARYWPQRRQGSQPWFFHDFFNPCLSRFFGLFLRAKLMQNID